MLPQESPGWVEGRFPLLPVLAGFRFDCRVTNARVLVHIAGLVHGETSDELTGLPAAILISKGGWKKEAKNKLCGSHVEGDASR